MLLPYCYRPMRNVSGVVCASLGRGLASSERVSCSTVFTITIMSPVINVANIYIGPCPAAGGRRVHIASRGHMRGVAGAPELRGMQPGAGHVRMQPHNLSGSTAS